MNNERRRVHAGLLVLACTLAIQATAAVYYVDTGSPSANDGNPGTATSPWKTIRKANTTVQAGSTVMIRAGTYSDGIAPSVTGTVAAPIVYQAYPGEVVVLTGTITGVLLNSINWVTISGLTVTNVTMFGYLISANNNTITNCTFRFQNGSSAWAGMALTYSSRSNVIVNCRLDHWGRSLPVETGDMIYIGDDTNVDPSYYNRIEGCTLGEGGHAVLSLNCGYNVVRGNMIRNEAWSSGYGERCIIMDGGPSVTTGCNLIESNRICFAANYQGGPAGGISLRTRQNIIRHNCFYNCSNGGIEITGGSGALDVAIFNHIYNNTFFTNGLDNAWPGEDAHAAIDMVVWAPPFVVKTNYLFNNLMWGHANTYENYGADALLSLQVRSNNWEQFSDPKFANVTNAYTVTSANQPDLSLLSTSPCIDAGAFLTKTTSGGSGTSMNVADAAFFFAGLGAVPGDTIQLRGSTATARITAISGNTLTLNTSLTWTNGQGVALPYAGSAPDIGAYEFGLATTNTNSAPVVSAGGAQTLGFPTNSATLVATASDPNGDTLSLAWSQIGGPAPASFSAANSLITSVTVPARGAYVFRFTASDGLASASADTTVTFLPDPSVIVLEAEAGTIASPFVVQGAYIVQNTETAIVANGGRAAYSFSVPSASDYTVTGLVNAPDDSANSLFVNIDAEPVAPAMVWDIPVTSGFEARTVSWRGTGGLEAPKVFSLAAGSHTLIIRGREAGVQLDQIQIMNAASASAGRPSLAIVRSAKQLVLSWPLWASNYVLETSSIFPLSASWTPLTNGIVTSETGFALTNSLGSRSLYRLRKQ